MGAAGRYSTAFTRLAYTRSQDADTGAAIEAWYPQPSRLRGELRIENGRRETEYGGLQTGMYATITINQFPTLDARDRLDDGDTVWVIESRYFTDTETVCLCRSFDAGAPE